LRVDTVIAMKTACSFFGPLGNVVCFRPWWIHRVYGKATVSTQRLWLSRDTTGQMSVSLLLGWLDCRRQVVLLQVLNL